MGQIFDAVFTILVAIGITASSGYALQKIGRQIQIAALTKTAQGLPSLRGLASGLTGHGKSHRTASERFRGVKK